MKQRLGFLLIIAMLLTSVQVPVFANEADGSLSVIDEVADEPLSVTDGSADDITLPQDTAANENVLVEDDLTIEPVDAPDINEEGIDMGQISSAYSSEFAGDPVETVYQGYPNEGANALGGLGFAKFKDKRVLLIQDTVPWVGSRDNYKIDTNQELLREMVAYDVTTTSEFTSINVNDYDVVILANDQSVQTYNNYAMIMGNLTEYAENGGIVIFGAADGGWKSGKLSAELPGGVTKTSEYQHYNEIADDTHPIATGELTDPENHITNDDLYQNYCSHVYFNKSSFPTGTRVIFQVKGNPDKPTLIEYPLGKGRVIASGLTWEYSYVQERAVNGYKAYSRKAMDDYFAYALTIAGLGNDAIDIIETGDIDENEHLIMVGDAVTREPLKDVKISCMAAISDVATNEKGHARLIMANKGLTPVVTLKKDGYKTKRARYTINGGDARYFFLSPKTVDDDIYVSGAILEEYKKDKNGNKLDEVAKTYDAMKDNVVLSRKNFYKLTIYGEWGDKTPGSYAVYIDNSYAYSSNGEFTIEKGKCSNAHGADVNFSGGRLHAKLVTSEASKSKGEELSVFAKPENEGSVWGSSNEGVLSIGGKDGIKFTLPDDVPILGNTDIQLDIAEIPFCIEINDDSAKIAIGFTDFGDDIKNPAEKWKEYKKTYADYKKGIKPVKAGKKSKFSMTKGWDADVDIMGYAEGKFDEDTGEITEISGEIQVILDTSYKVNNQYLVGPVPVYFEVGGGLKINTTSKVKGLLKDSGQLIVDNSLTLTPKFSIGGGVGINGALSVGAEGNVELPIVLCEDYINLTDNTEDKYTGFTLKGGMKLKASLLFVFKAEHEIVSGEWKIGRYYWKANKWVAGENPPEGAEGVAPDVNDLNAFSLMDRSYLSNDQGWYLSEAANAERVEADSIYSMGMEMLTQDDAEGGAQNTGISVLQRGLIPTSEPKVTALEDGRYLMVYQRDDETRESLNRTVLMYSVYENGVWSEPKPVWGDRATADLSASLVNSENGTYVVWQKQKKSYTDENTEQSEYAANVDIAAAKFDPVQNVFKDQHFLTDDGLFQMLPTAVAAGGRTYAMFAEDLDGKPLGGGNYRIKAVDIEDSTEILLYNGNEYVLSLAGTGRGGALEAAFILDKGNTDEDLKKNSEVYVYSNGTVNRLTNDEHSQMNVVYYGSDLYWYDGGNNSICVYDGAVTAQTVSGNMSIGSNFRLIENGDRNALVWIGIDEGDKNCVYESLKLDTGWTNPIEIVRSESAIMHIAPFIDNGKTYFLATADDGASGANLIFTASTTRIDTSVSKVAVGGFDEETDEYRISLDFNNASELSIQKLNVELLDAAGRKVYSSQADCSLQPGEKKHIELLADIPFHNNEKEYTIRIFPTGEENLKDNTSTIRMGYSDISVLVDQVREGDSIAFTAHIYNDGLTDSDISFIMREGDPSRGAVIDRWEYTDMKPGAQKLRCYVYDYASILFNDKKEKDIYFIVSGNSVESNYDNNTYKITIQNQEYVDEAVGIETPTAIEILSPDPVRMSLEGRYDYTLKTKLRPAKAAGYALEYSSNDESVAVVDEAGVIHARGSGTAKITVKAKNTTVSADVDVIVAPMDSTSFTILANETTPATKGYQVKDEYELYVSGNSTGKRVANDLFEYTSSDPTIASVTTDGKMTIVSQGQVTITAAVKSNPSVKATLDVDAIKQRAAKIRLASTDNTGSDQYAILEKEASNRNIQLVVTGKYENGDELTDISGIRYSFDNGNVAGVNAGGLITLTGVGGMATLTAELDDARASYTVNVCNNLKPNVILGSTVTVNPYRIENAEIVIEPIAGASIDNFDGMYRKSGKRYYKVSGYELERMSSKDERSLRLGLSAYAYTYTKGKLFIKVIVGENTYYLPIKVKLTKKIPSVSVKASKMNIFYTGAESVLDIRSSSGISDVTVEYLYSRGKINNGYKIEQDEKGEFVIAPTDALLQALANGTKLSKYNTRIRLNITLAGYNKTVTKKMKIPVSYKAPKFKLSITNFYSGNTDSTVIVGVKNADGKTIPDLEGASIDWTKMPYGFSAGIADVGTGSVSVNIPAGSGPNKGTMTLKLKDWNAPVKQNIKVVKGSNKIKLSKTADVNILYGLGDTVQVKRDGMPVTLQSKELIKDELFRIYTDVNGINIQPVAEKGSYTKSVYEYEPVVTDMKGNVIGDLKLKIKTNEKKQKFSINAKEVHIDGTSLGNTVVIPVRLNKKANIGDMSWGGIRVDRISAGIVKDGAASKDLSVISDLELGQAVIVVNKKNTGDYTVNLNLELSNGKQIQGGEVKVKALSTKVDVSTKGVLKATNRNGTVLITMKIDGYTGAIDKVELKDAWNSKFRINSFKIKGMTANVYLSVKKEVEIGSGEYKVPLRIVLANGRYLSVDPAVSVQSSNYNITASKSVLYLNGADMKNYGTLKSSIKGDSVNNLVQLDNQELFTVSIYGAGRYRLIATDRTKLTRKTYSIKCRAYSRFDTTDSQGKDILIKVQVK